MKKGCFYWLIVGWWWEPFILIFKLFFSKGFWKIILYMTLLGILLYVAMAVIPIALICFAIYVLYIIIKKILDGSLKKKYQENILYLKRILRKFRKTDTQYEDKIIYREPEKMIEEEGKRQINSIFEAQPSYKEVSFNNIEQIQKENSTEKQKIESEYKKDIIPVCVHKKKSFDWEQYAVICNAYVIREERKEKELKKLSRDLEELNTNLDNTEKQIDDMMASAVTVPNSFDNMDGHQFEYFCADILRKNGFENVEVTQGSGDHGIDILAEKDGITYAIQCKRYDKPVNNSAVQQAVAGKGIYKKDIAVVLTNNRFTPQAKEEAEALGVKLWDRDKLNELIGHNPS